MSCLFRLFRLLIVAAIVIVALVLLLPKFLGQAANTVLTNTDGNNPVSGLAQLIPASFLDKSNKLQLSLSGLDINKHYEVTLDPGTSCSTSGSIDVGLVTSDDNGNVNTTFSLSSLKGDSQGWSVDVHSGPSTSDPTVACNQLNTNDSSVAADATNTVLQLSPGTTNTDLTNSQSSSNSSSDSTTTTPKGLPNTGVAPGGNNSYDNNVYPRKF